MKTGDLVQATDPATGQTTTKPVTATILGIGNKNLIDLTIANTAGQTSTIVSTDNHPFWDATTQTWTPTTDLAAGDHLAAPDPPAPSPPAPPSSPSTHG